MVRRPEPRCLPLEVEPISLHRGPSGAGTHARRVRPLRSLAARVRRAAGFLAGRQPWRR